MKLIAPALGTKLAGLDYEYFPKNLLTPVETMFFEELFRLAGGRCHIMCKPRLADFIQHEEARGSFNKISQKHVDFLICRLDDCVPMMGIELDDSTHNTKAARENDGFKNNVFAHVGIPLMRIHVSEIEHLMKLKDRLDQGWVTRCARLELVGKG